MMKRARIGFLFGLLACSACLARPFKGDLPPEGLGRTVANPEGPEVGSIPDSPSSYNSGVSSRTIWNGSLVQGFVSWDGSGVIHYECREADPSGELPGYPYVSVGDWTTSYTVVDIIGGMGPYSFVVHGIARNGEGVFELFSLESQLGGYQFTPPRSGSGAFGIAIAGGGPYLVPTARVPLAPPRRIELYRGSSLGTDLLATIAPDGSMLYVISRAAHHLWCVPRDSPLPPVEYLLGSNQNLLAGAKEIGMRGHAEEGDKVYVFIDYGSLPLSVLLISDYDGDRYLDADELMDTSQYEAFGYPGLWTTDYMSDPSVLAPY